MDDNDDDDSPTQEGSFPFKVAQVAARKEELKQALKEKDKQQIAFIAECTIDDVVVDDEAPKSLKGSGSKTTALQTIKGACIKQIGASILRQFCINNKIEGYRNKTKLQYCEMIAERKRHSNLDEVMYPKDFEDPENNDDGRDGEPDDEGAKKSKKKLSKGTKPREITRDGSLYRVILVYFLQELRPFVLRLGLNPTPVELGTAGFLHEAVYNKLASVYNDASLKSLLSFKIENDIYVTSGVQEDAPATFDKLSALAFCQAMNFLNKHYREAVRKRTLSGNHKPFYAYCTNRPYLLLYYDYITECGDTVLGSLACPKLPESVKRTSLMEDGGIKEETSSNRAERKREGAAEKLVEVSTCLYSRSNEGPTESVL
jgi:hypothetical protein